jgi:3-oxoacyl-[acyl-carrier-protein] synthase-3
MRRLEMAELKTVGIIGIGEYVPEKVMTNFDLEKIVETNDEWIRTRTGIQERRIAADDEACSDLAYKAALKALEDSNTKPEELDLIIVATMTPDYPFPSTAALVERKLGATKAGAFDLGAACSGFVYGIATGANFIASGAYKKVLVIGAEVISRILDWEDRNTCVLFGDGAAAVVLGEVDEEYGIKGCHLGAKGDIEKVLYQPAGGAVNPASIDSVKAKQHFLKMQGSEVFKFAVKALPEGLEKALEISGMEAKELDMIVPHQANVRIIQAAAKRFDLPMDKFYMNLHKYGNTSSASVGIALTEAVEEGKIKKGDNVALVGFGAGLTYAACILKWAK